MSMVNREEIREFARKRLLPPQGEARVYSSGRTDVGDYKRALELLLILTEDFLGKSNDIHK